MDLKQFLGVFYAIFVLFGLSNISAMDFVTEKKVTPGRVIFITGTTSAGKSSVTPEIVDLFEEQYGVHFKVTSLDEYNAQEDREDAAARDESSADASSELDQSDDCSDSEKEMGNLYAFDNQEKFFESIYLDASQGENIIVDTVIATQANRRLMEDIFGDKLHIVLLYCPINEIIARLESRNSLGTKEEQRTYRETLIGILDIYTINKESTGSNIDTCSRGDIEAILAKVAQELITQETAHRETDLIMRSLRAQLDCQEAIALETCYYITPKEQYNFWIINTFAKTPRGSAQETVDRISPRLGLTPSSCTAASPYSHGRDLFSPVTYK